MNSKSAPWLAVLIFSSSLALVLAAPSFPEVRAVQQAPVSGYFGNTFNATSLGEIYITNTTQIVDVRFTARYGGTVVPQIDVGMNYYAIHNEYDLLVGVQTDAAGRPSGHFLGAFVWNVSSGLCNGCGGWVSPGFAPKAGPLNHTVTLTVGTVYHIVVKYFNGTFVNTGACYGADCLVFRYIDGANIQQESLDRHFDANQALLYCGSVKSCSVVPGANAVYALNFNGSAWWQGQTEDTVVDRGIGVAKGGSGLDSFEGERFWMSWSTVTVDSLQVILSRIGSPTGRLNVLIWNFTAASPSSILGASHPQIVLNQTLISNLSSMPAVTDRAFNFSLGKAVTFETDHLYQLSFAIYANTTAVDGSNEVGIEVTASDQPNALNWDGVGGIAAYPCPQYSTGCAGFRYTGGTENVPAKEIPAEDLIFIMKVSGYAVSQPITVGMINSAPSANITVNRCYSSPSVIPSDGKPHLVEMIPACSFSLAFSNTGDARDGFSISGSFSATSIAYSSCSSGTCANLTLLAYRQLQNSYRAVPVNPVAWDANLSIAVSGTQLGAAGQTGCSISTTKGGGAAQCEAWFDYHTQVHVASPVAVSGTERWIQSGGNNFTQTTGGNLDKVSYVDQFQVSFSVNPEGGGSTTPSGSKQWESFGSLLISGTPSSGYLFSTWSTDVSAISFASADGPSTTATIHGTGNITATFVLQVSQPITLTIAGQGGTSANFTLSGCSVSPTSVAGDGLPHSITAKPSCQVTIAVPADTKNSRYRFNSGQGPSSTISVLTCANNTCPAFFAVYYEQVSQQFAYAVVGGGAPYLRAPVLTLSALGTKATYTEDTSPTTVWIDFGTPWSLVNSLPGPSNSERWVTSLGTSGTATAGATQTTIYQHQYSIAISATPTDCGSTTPSGVVWQNVGANFAIQASAASGCTFSAWQATGLVTIAQPAESATTAFSDSNGTMIALFTRNPLPLLSVNRWILLLGLGVTGAAAVVTLVIGSRSSHPRSPSDGSSLGAHNGSYSRNS